MSYGEVNIREPSGFNSATHKAVTGHSDNRRKIHVAFNNRRQFYPAMNYFGADDETLTSIKSFYSKITRERFAARVLFLDGHSSFRFLYGGVRNLYSGNDILLVQTNGERAMIEKER